MSWRDTYKGNFLKAADLPKSGKRVKITSVDEEVLGKGERPKLVAELRGLDQRWVLNATNCELLEEIFGSDEPDDWSGTAVELFNDKSVRGPNNEKGGIRVRETANRGSKKTQEDAGEDTDDIDDDLDDLDDD